MNESVWLRDCHRPTMQSHAVSKVKIAFAFWLYLNVTQSHCSICTCGAPRAKTTTSAVVLVSVLDLQSTSMPQWVTGYALSCGLHLHHAISASSHTDAEAKRCETSSSFHNVLPLTGSAADSGCSSKPSCHMLRSGEVSGLSVHLSDSERAAFLHYQGFPPISFCRMKSGLNADLLLVSEFFSAFSVSVRRGWQH